MAEQDPSGRHPAQGAGGPNVAAATAGEATSPRRLILVVIDETMEHKVALHYACRLAARGGGRVALMYAIEPAEFQHWMAVEELMREEKRAEAEQRLLKLAKDVVKLTGVIPVFYIREGKRRDELLRLIEDDGAIVNLVLAAGTGPEGPGPLISYLTGAGVARLKVPLTIVPGSLTPAELDRLA